MTEITTSVFLNKGGVQQFERILTLYPTALRLKSETKSKPQELIKLDEWYQTTLPKALKSRNPSHLTHEELINIIKWKQTRGKFRPKLKELVTMNSPRVVVAESKKAFRAFEKKGDLSVAVAYLCNLKGIGPSTASAILTAYAPDRAAFMADECLAAVPEIEGIDCSTKEYLDLMRHLKEASTRLNTTSNSWTPHQVELTLWTHYTLLMLKPELLQEQEILPVVPRVDDGLVCATSDDSNSMDSRGFIDGVHNGNANGLRNGIPALATDGILLGQDLDEDSSLPTTDEPNSNSPVQYSKNLEESSEDTPSPQTYSQPINTEKFEVCDENASGEVTTTYCSSDSIDHETEAYEPDRKRVKVD